MNIKKIILEHYLDVVNARALYLGIGTPRVSVDALHRAIEKIRPAPFLRDTINLCEQLFRQVAHQEF